MKRLRLRLFWEGSWDLTDCRAPQSVPSTPGIFMITAVRDTGNPAIAEEAEIIYIGESDNLRIALLQSKQWNRWVSLANGKSLHLTISKTDHLLCRRTIAAVLTFQNKPLANSRFVNISMFRYVHVDVTNYGNCGPLRNPSIETPTPIQNNNFATATA